MACDAMRCVGVEAVRWVKAGIGQLSQLSDDHEAFVWRPSSLSGWVAQVSTPDGGHVWQTDKVYPDEAAAKAAVCYWIGTTISKFGNALARGEPRIPVDEE